MRHSSPRIAACLVLYVLGSAACGSNSGEGEQDPETACETNEQFFAREVWAQTLAANCLGCHNPQGLASATGFVLQDPTGYPDGMKANYDALVGVAERFLDDDERPIMLRKPTGELGHGGGTVIQADSPHYKRLEEFLVRLDTAVECPAEVDFLAGVELETPYQTLRRFALLFAYRLPTSEEVARVDEGGTEALTSIMDEMMTEEAFGERIAEGFNDVLLTDGNAFEIAMLGTVNHRDLLWFTDFPQPERGTALSRTVFGVTHSVNALIKNIVLEDEPFSNILLADYTMVNPYSARSLGAFDSISWQDPDDPNEFHPTQLLYRDEGLELPHAGVLNNYIYLNRYRSTPTNVNRARARAFLLHFLGTDILKFSPVLSDPLAVIAAHDNPIRDAADCAVCHVILDPIAGVYHNYQSGGARYNGPVPLDSFPPGFELTSQDGNIPVGERTWSGGLLPEEREFDSLLWLAETAVADRRFAPTMAKHFYALVVGRPILEPPTGDAVGRNAFRAYEEQQAALKTFSQNFVASNYNAKALIKDIVLSPYFRGRYQSDTSEELEAMRFDMGTAQILTPEQLHRKIVAVFGDAFQTFPLFKDGLLEPFNILYGGIDSTQVTERILTPNGVMAGVQQLVSNNVSCRQVSREFDKAPQDRLLFAGIELSQYQSSDEAEIRAVLVHLHERVLGERISADAPAIDLSYDLFRRVQERGAAEIADGNISELLRRPCEAGSVTEDPQFAVRAWAAVLNYQMQSFEFLYQ
tara:strand:- start:99850 stop:102111 length:2262 start_codon:yes stop_codon:yes gene_type:complete